MEKLFKNSWALFVGYAFIMLAFGLQGNLLGVKLEPTKYPTKYPDMIIPVDKELKFSITDLTPIRLP